MGDTENYGSWPYATNLTTYKNATGETLGIGISAETIANQAAIAEDLQNNTEEYTDEQAGGSYGETVAGEVSSDVAGYLGWMS